MLLRGRTMFAPTMQIKSTANTQKKKSDALSAFSFDEEGAKEKATKKKSAVIELSRSAERDRRRRRLAPPFEKGGRKL